MPSPIHYLLQQNIGVGGAGGLLNSAQFIAVLRDSGAGAVDTSLTAGTGSATFTRATTAATKLSTGLWKLDVASGTARSCYLGMNTAAGAYGGYLQEQAATQLALNPRDMTQAAWVAVNVTPAQTATGIDGVANSATRLTATAISGSILQTLVAAATDRTYSCWIRRVTGTGTITISQGATTADVTAQINSATYTLVQLDATVLNSAFGITFGTSGDVIEVDCNQFEAGPMATTPIPAAGSRNVDILTYQFAGNALTTVGTIYAENSTLNAPTSSVIVGYTTTVNNAVRQSATATQGSINDGTNTVTKTGMTSPVGVVVKRAGSYGASGMSFTGDGLAISTGSFDGAMANTAIAIGSSTNGAAPLNGTVKNVRIWQQQLPDVTLVSLTS